MDMINVWSGCWIDPVSQRERTFDWEEVPEETIHLMEVMKS
jgi:hypothetical protein